MEEIRRQCLPTMMSCHALGDAIQMSLQSLQTVQMTSGVNGAPDCDEDTNISMSNSGGRECIDVDGAGLQDVISSMVVVQFRPSKLAGPSASLYSVAE